MKKKFSTTWKSSKQPRKQRKYRANAPLHLRKKFVNINLSKELRTKYERRNIQVKKNDIVKIMRGKYKGKKGKVLEVKLKLSKIIVEGIQVKKQDGSKANVKMQPSNLQIIELNLEGRKKLIKKEIKTKETLKPKEGTGVKKVDSKENKVEENKK